MSDDGGLIWEGEVIDVGTPLIARYGSVWAVWLLAAASSLKNPEVWSGLCDVDAATQQADELVVRLMGMGELFTQVAATLPLTIEPLHMADEGVGTTETFYAAGEAPRLNCLKSGTLDGDFAWVSFEVALLPGDYLVHVAMSVGPSRAQAYLSSDVKSTIAGDVISLYAAAADHMFSFSRALTVLVGGLQKITIHKYWAVPASSSAILRLYPVTIVSV